MFDSMIFDMDGTLVNCVKEITASWNETCKRYNWNKVFTCDDIQNVMGLNGHDIGVILFPDVDEDEATRRIEVCSHEEIAYLDEHSCQTYIPNKYFLEKLSKKYKLFIISNCLEGYIEIFLKNFKLEKYFIDSANAANGNTKAENIKYIVSKYNLKNPVYVGDTIKDMNSSLEANVEFIHAAYGFGKVDCKNKINKLEDLLKWE